MTFGNPFGLALYDKQQRQVTSSVREKRGPQGQGPLVQAGHPHPVGETRAIRPEVQALAPAQSPAATSDAVLPNDAVALGVTAFDNPVVPRRPFVNCPQHHATPTAEIAQECVLPISR